MEFQVDQPRLGSAPATDKDRDEETAGPCNDIRGVYWTHLALAIKTPQLRYLDLTYDFYGFFIIGFTKTL